MALSISLPNGSGNISIEMVDAVELKLAITSTKECQINITTTIKHPEEENEPPMIPAPPPSPARAPSPAEAPVPALSASPVSTVAEAQAPALTETPIPVPAPASSLAPDTASKLVETTTTYSIFLRGQSKEIPMTTSGLSKPIQSTIENKAPTVPDVIQGKLPDVLVSSKKGKGTSGESRVPVSNFSRSSTTRRKNKHCAQNLSSEKTTETVRL